LKRSGQQSVISGKALKKANNGCQLNDNKKSLNQDMMKMYLYRFCWKLKANNFFP